MDHSKTANMEKLKELTAFHLRPWEEMVGRCVGLAAEKQELIIDLIVHAQHYRIIAPAPLDVGNSNYDANTWVGARIGVLRTDSQTAPFAVRIIGET